MSSTIFDLTELNKVFMAKQVPQWWESSLNQFIAKIDDPEFPCFYAAKALNQGFLLFSFANSTMPQDVKHCAESIKEYLDYLNQIPPEAQDETTLILFINPSASREMSFEDCAEKVFQLMQGMRQLDTMDWPEHIPKEPNHPKWSYCLFGSPLFINISTPANIKRRSRNLGDGITLVIQPRESFEHFLMKLGDEAFAEQTRLSIRKRASRYDDMEWYPYIVSYGKGDEGYEMVQYAIPENNYERCPFHW